MGNVSRVAIRVISRKEIQITHHLAREGR